MLRRMGLWRHEDHGLTRAVQIGAAASSSQVPRGPSLAGSRSKTARRPTGCAHWSSSAATTRWWLGPTPGFAPRRRPRQPRWPRTAHLLRRPRWRWARSQPRATLAERKQRRRASEAPSTTLAASAARPSHCWGGNIRAVFVAFATRRAVWALAPQGDTGTACSGQGVGCSAGRHGAKPPPPERQLGAIG